MNEQWRAHGVGEYSEKFITPLIFKKSEHSTVGALQDTASGFCLPQHMYMIYCVIEQLALNNDVFVELTQFYS